MAMAAGMAAGPLIATRVGGAHAASGRIKAVAFDGFAIFDPRAVFATARDLFPGRSDDLHDVWMQKLFAYTSLRNTARRYAPFVDVIAQSLAYAAGATGIPLSTTQRERLIGAFWMLPMWPDAPDRLRALHDQGIRLAFLSNMSDAMLMANMRHNGIASLFETTLSTDRVGAFKPAPEAYALAEREFGVDADEIAFAAFAGWDAAGASWFGYPTAWVNRLGQPAETVDAPKVLSGRDLTVVTDLVREFA